MTKPAVTLTASTLEPVTLDGEDRPITEWEDRDGIVYVNGERALNAGSGGLRTDWRIQLERAFCRRCDSQRRTADYTAKVALYGRFESALGRPFYWFKQVTWCPRCEPAKPSGIESEVV
jgi:hypothetical protein